MAFKPIRQIKGIDRRFTQANGLLDAAALLEANIDEINREVLKETAEHIVNVTRSNKLPVDTGTYVSSHRVSAGSQRNVPRTESSRKKPRGVAPGPAQAAGLSAMLTDISEIPEGGAGEARFYNTAEHADAVEFRGWTTKDKGRIPPYRVYAQTKSEFNNIVKRMRARLGIK